MNKSELIAALAKKAKLTEKNAAEIVNLIFDGFTDTLMKGDRIEIRGLGSFCVRKYEGYTGRNPKTGKDVKVKPKRLPFFKVGVALKKRVDGYGKLIYSKLNIKDQRFPNVGEISGLIGNGGS